MTASPRRLASLVAQIGYRDWAAEKAQWARHVECARYDALFSASLARSQKMAAALGCFILGAILICGLAASIDCLECSPTYADWAIISLVSLVFTAYMIIACVLYVRGWREASADAAAALATLPKMAE